MLGYCAAIGVVFYFSEYEQNPTFAKMVQQKLDAYKTDDPNMGQVSQQWVNMGR